jgi:hypothetical protein
MIARTTEDSYGGPTPAAWLSRMLRWKRSFSARATGLLENAPKPVLSP